MAWHSHILKMLRHYPNDPRTPDHLRPNKLMVEAADRIDYLEGLIARAVRESKTTGYVWGPTHKEFENVVSE